MRQAFLRWLDERDLWFAQYSAMADLLEKHLLWYVAADPTLASHVAGPLWDVLHCCDQIAYDDPGVAEAYVALHFLDRYHRFQVVSRTLIERGLLPFRGPGFRGWGIDILDIGTGPGPALYSLSDTYALLSRFGAEARVPALESIEWNLDYAETSSSFRQWLHRFTEFLMDERPDWTWKVPFHSGTFGDFRDIEFDSVREIDYGEDEEGYEYRERYVQKRRYDIIVLSNFLTTVDRVAGFGEQLQKCMRYLRNRGILLVVGASAESGKYADVYAKLSEAIQNGRYGNWKLIAHCELVDVKPSTLCYSYADRYGERLKRLYSGILDEFREIGVAGQIPEAALGAIETAIEPAYDKEIAWEFRVFRKHCRMRPRGEQR